MKRGFTLVELLIYIGLLSILLGVLTRIFLGITDLQLTSEATGAVEEDSRYLYARFVYDVSRAESIVTPAVPGEESQTLTLLIHGVANTYSISGTNLILANDGGAHPLNSINTRISGASFTRVGVEGKKNSVKMTLTVTSTSQNASGPDVKTIETAVALK